MKDSLSFTHCQSRRASHRIAWRVKALSGMVALITLTLGDIAQAVETVFVSPNVLTVGGAEGFSNADDAVSAPVPIGFTFCYGGVDYTQAVMSTNGVLYFSGADISYTNGALSGRTSQLGVYALWDDLFVGPSGNPSLSTAIYYTSGSPGNRVFIMQWTTWYSYNEPYEVGTFNVVLYEGTNKIDIYYRNMLGTSVQRGYGASATIGLAVTSTYSTQYSIDSAVATEGKLLTYTPSAGGATPYSLTEQTVTPATTAAIPTYYLLASTNPKQPTNLSAAPGTPAATSATLSWDLSTSGVDPTTYTIRYATNEQMADLTETSSFSPPEQTYILTGLTQGQTYYWQVVSRVGTLYTSSITSTFRQTANQAPVASAGSFSTQANTPYSGQLVATDADNNPTSSGLIYSITSPPGSGSAVITNSATGAFTYTPANGFAGNTSFGFKAFDGTAYSAEAIISVAVISTGPSVASNNAIVIINEGNSASNTGTFSDPEGNSTVAISASIGSISKDSAAGTWSWSYTPADGPDNSQTVTITANDGVNTPVTTTFALTVNNIAPTALAQSVATNEDTTKDITLAASDPGADTQTFSIVNGPTQAQGTLSAVTGNQVTFTPALNFNGSASFTFKATDSDGADSAPAAVTLTVDAVNDAPSFTPSMAGGDARINGLTVGGTTYYPAGGTTVAVAPDLTYTNSGSPTTTGAQVSIDNGQSSDVLGWNTTLATSYGVSGSYNTTSKVLSFTGTATTGQYQDILRSVTYKNAAGTPTADRTISFNVGLNTLYNPGNGHYYEYISSTLNWTSAKAAAAARTFQGMNGYLATVTTQSENDFIKTKLLADAWIGASDDFGQINSAVGSTLYANQSASEGKWYWVTGPEAGIQFSQNNSPLMSSVSGRYQRWNGGEPNNAGSEHYAEFYTTSFWNDLPNGSVLPYVVEYGGLPGDPVLTLSLTGSRTITYAPMVLEDSGPFLGGTNFVTSISPGPNESGQTVSFTVTNSDNSLFSVQPVISPSGTLTFTPALNAYGWCTVSVTAVDSGGIDNGGVNTSAARTFTLSIGPVNDAPIITSNGGGGTASISIAESTTPVTTVTATDAEVTATQTLTYSKSGPDAAKFTLNPSSGELAFTTAPDFDIPGDANADNIYLVTVTATDSNSPSASDSQDLNVTVTNVNETPVIARNTSAITVNEGNSASNTGTFSDPEGNATITLTASLGTATPNNGAGTWSWSYTPSDGPDDSQIVTITANDGVNPVVTTTFALTVNNVAPTALAQSVATNEDTAKDITLAASDPGADTQTFSIVNGPTQAQGTLSAVTGNQVTFTPALNFNGSANFTFKATDSDGAASNTATVSITIEPVNDQPVVARANANVTVNEGSPAANTGTFNDADGNATATISASIGSITQNNAAGTWSWSYTPTDGPDDSQTVTITADDGVNPVVTTTFALTVNNVAPTALAQSVATNEDTAKDITLAASDPGADTQTFSIVNGPTPAQGTLSAIAGNQVTFTPALNFNGSASFTFKATDSDGADSNTATVSITVSPVNDQPAVATDNATVITNEGSLASNTGTFNDIEGNATATVTASIGTVTQNNVAGTWSWNYTPGDGPDNSQTVTITANDGVNAPVNTTFALTVNNVAPAALAQTVTTIEDTAKLITLGANDPGSDTQTFSIVTGPTPAQGTLSTISGNQVTFTPAPNFNGPASFTFEAMDSDGASSNTATVNITVDSANDQPTITRTNAAVTTDEGSLVSNTGTFGDADGTATTTLTASIGALAQNNTTGTWSWSYTPSDGPDDSQTVTITATDNGSPALVSTATFALTVNNAAPTALAQTVTVTEDMAKLITLEASDPGADTQSYSIVTGPTPEQGTLNMVTGNQVTFTPAPNFSGSASFTFKATDSDGAASNTATVSITIEPVNDQPVVARANANVTLNEGSPAANTGTFNDADGNATATISASIGSITQNNTAGTWSWSYTPSDGPDDSQTVTITVTDDGSPALVSTATFALTVNNVAPTALAQTVTVTEDMAKLITLEASDPGADTQSYSIVTGPTPEQGTLSMVTGNQVTFTPALNFNGSASFTFKATDSDSADSAPATVTIIVDSVNDQPVIARANVAVTVNEGSLASNTGTFSDADGNATATLTASIGTLTQNKAAGTWTWSYTPTDGPDDSQTVTITATDNGSPALVSTTTFALTVNNVAPTALAQSITTDEDTSTLVTLDANDPGADTQTFSIVIGPTVAQGRLSAITGNQVTFTPALNFHGDASFTFKATDSDGGESNIATVSITVDAVNDTPVVASDHPAVTVDEDSLATNTGTFADTEGNATVTLTASVGSISQNDTNGTWSWSYTPADGTDDSQTVTITATDNGSPALVSTSTFALTVKNVAPTALAQSVTAAEDTSKAITLGATDPGQDTLTFSVVTGPTEAQGTLSVVSGNQVTFTPALNFNGSASFIFKATDSDGAVSNTAMVSLEVTESNDAPSFVPGSNISIPSGSALQQVQWASSITAGADDESEQALSFVVINDNNTIFAVQPSIDAEGVLTYQPAFAARVVATVTVTLVETAEGGLAAAPHTFTISMTGDPGSGVFETMSTFANSAAGPKGPIVRDASGSLWGTTAMGGVANQGTLWKLNPTGDFRTVADLGTAASFNAKKGGGLVRGFDGNFYITATGDATGFGSVLRVSPDGALSSVQTSTGSQTAATTVLGSDGFLYGGNKTALIKLAPTSGIVWSAKLPANTVLRYPLLEWLDGNFYGTSVLGGTSNLGVVFKVSRTGQYTVVKNLTAALGSRPSGSLITGHDGAIYGVTSTGGANGTGTVFRVTSSGNHRIVASFPAGAGSPGNIVLGSDGCYYGTRFSSTFGAIYKMTASGVLSTLVTFTGATGIAPGAVTADTVESLLYGQDGILYGATGLGGTANGGVLYSLTTTGTYTVLRHMAAVINDPQGALADDSVGDHFGTNATGGTGQGSIFAVAPNGVVTDIHTFSGNDGSSPQSGLAFASDGNYYGTTSTGGTAGLGTLFRMTPDGVVTTLFSFTGTTGLYRGSTPLGPLTANTTGSLYGTTSKGGSSNLGTVFSLNNLNGVPTYTVLANFIGKNGSTPVGGVAIDSDGKLFGTTRSGGGASRGCIYKILGPDTRTPALSVVASFTGTTGLAPGNNSQATLIRGVDGKFYGTARQGGASDAGTLFRISSAGVFELLTSFTNTSGLAIGKQPEGIVKGPDGRIYGTTALGGAAGFGVLFALDPVTKAYTVRKQFEGGSLGIQGRGLPLMGRDGNLHGFTASTVWRMTFAKQPTARTRPATAVTSTSATLNGTVNANGLNTTVQFEFGPTTAYGTTRSAMPAPAFGTADTLVSLPVANLEPHTIYHYRLLVTAGAHVLASADQTVTTLNTAPEAFSDTIVTNASMNIVADELPDQDGDLLDIHSVALPAAGSLARLSATNVQYTPTAELATRGYDQFIYQVGDGTDMSPPALLTVRYQPPTGLPPTLPADAVVLPTSAEDYATWATATLPNTVAGDDRLPNGDADRDRISNALECLMATNPTVSNASTFVIDTSGNPAFSKVRYTRQKGLVEGFETLEESADGMNWRAVDHSRQLMKRTNGTITDSVETTIVPVPGTSALPYFRLVISL